MPRKKGAKAKGKAKAKAKARKDFGIVKLGDVEKELKKVIPLIDKKLALEGVERKYQKELQSDAEFKRWAAAMVASFADKLANFSVENEAIVEQVQLMRAGQEDKKLAKAVHDKYKDNAINTLITLEGNLKTLLGDAAPEADRIARHIQAK